MSTFSNPGAQTIGPGAQQFLLGAVRKIIWNVVTWPHDHISHVVIIKAYQSIGGIKYGLYTFST